MPERILTPELPSFSILALLTRFFCYTTIIIFCMASLPILLQNGYITIFEENGLVEWLQFTCLITVCSILIIAGIRNFVFRELALLLAFFSAFAATRELDAILDVLIPWFGWKIVYVFVPCVILLAVKNRYKIGWQASRLFSSPGFALLWAGFIVAIPLAQLLGHGPLLEAIVGHDDVRSYKRVIEESGEFVGYLLLIAGSVESLVSMRSASYCKVPQWDAPGLKPLPNRNWQTGIA